MGNQGVLRRFSGIGKYTEAWLAALLFMVLALIVVPMPPAILDFFISLNLMFAVVILLTSMYISRALDFSVFPALLLVTTLLRISISIGTARVILGRTAPTYHEASGTEADKIEAALGSAGHVIQSFGELVAGGNAVIGIIMFIVITVVQFVVVAQGAGRVSEVAARFTLDAMPGKQMAIDAELNSRIITPEEAKAKRTDLENESNFFGAMDGAMKFVKGDAIAGIIIVIVNIIGGFIVGGLMGGMPFSAAAQTFTVLTVGQGLIEQIPALLIAVAAGLVVTRSAAPQSLGGELGRQLTQSNRALVLAAIMIGIIGVVPGLPHIPLLSLAFLLGFTAYQMNKRSKRAAQQLEGEIGDPTAPAEEISQQMLRTDPILLEVGNDLAALADPELAGGGELLERLKHVRRRIALEYGVIAPGVRVRPHPSLNPGQYQLRIKGDLVAEGEVLVTHQLGIGHDLSLPGIQAEETQDPIYGTPAVWIPNAQKDAAVSMQPDMQLFDAQDVVSTHVAEVIKLHLDELLTREEVAELLNMARQDAPTVVAELVPNLLSLGQIRQVLQNLVREQVPIKDLPTILNALADHSIYTKDSSSLTEHVRAALARKICQRYQSPDGMLHAFTLSPEAERAIQQSIQIDETGHVLRLDPNQSSALQGSLAHALTDHRGEYIDPVIVTPPKIRRHVKALLERNFSKLVVLSYSEIAPGVTVNNLDTVNIH